jgi:hypothetical protein
MSYEGEGRVIEETFSSAKELLSRFKPGRGDAITITVHSLNDEQRTQIDAEVGGTYYDVSILYTVKGVVQQLPLLSMILDFVEFGGDKIDVLLPEMANFIRNLDIKVPHFNSNLKGGV